VRSDKWDDVDIIACKGLELQGSYVKPRDLRVQPEGSLLSLLLCVVTRVSRVSESACRSWGLGVPTRMFWFF